MEENTALNTDPKKFIIAGLLVIFIFFGGIGAWSLFFPFKGAVIAPGTVKVAGERRVVQHLEGGIIDEIRVEEGDRVKKGEVLIRLKSARIDSSVDLLQGRLRAKWAEMARLMAEVTMEKEIDWPAELLEMKESGGTEVEKVMAKENDIFQSRRSDLEGKISLYRSQIKQLEKRIEGTQEELQAQQEVIANLNEELAAKRSLLQEKYLGKSQILELERMLSESKGRKGKLKQNIAEYNQQIEELKLRIVDIKNQYREKAVSQLGEVKDTIFELREQIKPQLDAQQRLEVKAPIGGEVINMRVNSEESGVIQAGMPLLDIVPARSPLKIYAQVRPQDITRVKKGQKTKVQLSAFERGKVPPLPGKVVYVSGDLISQDTPRGRVSYYEVHVAVEEGVLEKNNAYLSPGMPVACYITTDKRSIISYLLDPLLENVDRAMRE